MIIFVRPPQCAYGIRDDSKISRYHCGTAVYVVTAVMAKTRFWGTFQNANVCPFALGLGSWELYGYIKNR